MSDVINAHDLGVAGGYIIEAAMQGDIDQLKAENAELRNDADLLRAMLSQVQTEKRCYMAENAKLREDLEFERSENGWAREFLNRMGQKCGTKDCPSLVAYVTKLEADNAELRELVRDMWRDGMCECDERGACAQCEYHFTDRMRDLGVEVDA